jgi:hypothetical protein
MTDANEQREAEIRETRDELRDPFRPVDLFWLGLKSNDVGAMLDDLLAALDSCREALADVNRRFGEAQDARGGAAGAGNQ